MDNQCIDPRCFMEAALTRDGTKRCVAHHREANGGRIV